MGRISVVVVKPAREMIARRDIKATDRAWKEALFGIAGNGRRIGGARLGNIGVNPVSAICELPEVVAADTPVWLLRADDGPFIFGGPVILFNDAGYGPADLGVAIAEIRRRIDFTLTDKAKEAALEHMRNRKDQQNA